jgi:lipid-binding SYLF domain-containing protein
MLKKSLILLALAACLILPGISKASDRDDDIARLRHSADVFGQILNTPDRGIPDHLLSSAKCIAVIPGDKTFALVFGGNYGRGVAACRTDQGWSAPIFLAVEGGSVGYQIGGSSTDLVLLFMNDHAMRSMLGDKFKLGADATVAAGPVGRDASAGTDVKLNAEILSYSRTKGAFAGVSLDGTVVQADRSGDRAMYGENVTRQQILGGSIAIPAEARPFLQELNQHPKESAAVRP